MSPITCPDTALEALRGIDMTAADSAHCADILGQTKLVRGWLDAIESSVTSRQRELSRTTGAAPAADLHTKCGGVSAAEGRRKDRRSETIEQAPSFGDALAAGTIGAEHVDALANATAKLTDDVKTSLLDRAQELLVIAATTTPEQFGRRCRDRARRLERDHGLARNRQQRRDTFLSRRVDGATGMIEGRFAFHPELANQIFGAIDHEVAATIAAGERSGDAEFVNRSYDRNRLAAEALGRLIAGGHQQMRPLHADITVIVDAATAMTGELHDDSVCETSEGLPIPPQSLRRLLCEGAITPIFVNTDGAALDAGRTIRHANRKQRRALRAMYRTCAFYGCDVPFDRCETHHIIPWELGGATDLENLLPLCARHHHVIHEVGWQVTLDPGDRTLIITQPDATIFAQCRPDICSDLTQHRRRQPAA